jgi:hypothetical protein
MKTQQCELHLNASYFDLFLLFVYICPVAAAAIAFAIIICQFNASSIGMKYKIVRNNRLEQV